MKRTCRSAFTLVELLVVIVILVALTTVALHSVDGLQEQGRHDATRRQLEEIETAVLGPANRTADDGTPESSGFVADLGRLPRTVGTDPLLMLAELWLRPSGVAVFGLKATTDSDIRVEAGWRGPYLRLGVTETELHDGWGGNHPFQLLDAADAAIAADGVAVRQVESLGADGTVGGANFNIDLRVSFVRTATSVDRVSSRVTGNILEYVTSTGLTRSPVLASGETLEVRYFGPDSATGGVQEANQTISSAAGPFTFDTNDMTVVGGSGAPAVTIGPRYLRAYKRDSGNALIGRSIPVRLVLRAGGRTRDLMIILP